MFWRNKKSKSSPKARMFDMGFRAIFAGGCFAAFAIFAWDVELASVLELVLLLVLIMVTMMIPAALFVGLLKLISYGLRRVRSDNK